MSTSQQLSAAWNFRCLHCRGALTSDPAGLECAGCGRQYPVVDGIPLLVSEPMDYLRSELALLNHAMHDGKRRRDLLDRGGRDTGLTKASLDRHRDVIDAEMARATTFLALLEPAAKALEATPDNSADARGARRSGWVFESLLPYLLRDWTGTAELRTANALISAALGRAFPDACGIRLVLAGCGAGGLLAEIPADFEHVIGFDLTLPVLAAARHLLDGKSIDLTVPHAINELGRLTLHNHGLQGAARALVAMDAFDTAFADGSVDCVVTSFLIDLIPDPRKLADEIHRILSPNGIWINYGPSGPLRALWRFDQSEGAAFFEAGGFCVVQASAHRATYLDLSRDCPTWSFQSHMCYLTSARKMGQVSEKIKAAAPGLAELPQVIPEHFPGAILIRRERLAGEHKHSVHLRHERSPGVVENLDIGSDTARIVALVDGKRTVLEIANILQQEPGLSVEEAISAFARYFDTGLLTWRNRGDDSA